MRPTRIRTASIVAATVAAALGLGACSGGSSDDADPKASATATAPKGFDVPAGVTLTDGGTSLAQGKPATVVYQVGDAAASAVTVTVTRVKKGSIDDFRFFSLDAETKKSAPYYVSVTVKNEGPAGLGGGALPVYAHDSSNTNLPANDIVGTFKPCRSSKLPKSFLPGSDAKLCLVYLVPKGRKLQSIALQTDAKAEPISWNP